MDDRVSRLWSTYTHASGARIKSLIIFILLKQDPPGITADVDCQWQFSCFLLMSFPLINICIIQINDNKVRGFPLVVATIWIDWRVFREEWKEWERDKKKQCTVLGNNGQWRTKAEILFNVEHRYPVEVERAERREVRDCAVTMILPGQGYEIQVNQES